MGDSIETPRGILTLALPATLAAAPATSKADEAKEGAEDRELPLFFPEFEYLAWGSGVVLALLLAGAGINSIRSKGNAKRFLERRLRNQTIGAKVSEGLSSFRVHSSWNYVGDGSRQMTNLAGLSPEAGRLAYDIADALEARGTEEGYNFNDVLREVGATSLFADFWRDAFHEENAWRMGLTSLMLHERLTESSEMVRVAVGRTLMGGALRKRDFRPENVFGIAAEEHQRIGRARKIRTAIFSEEVMLVQALHMLAATTLWLERADYSGRSYDRQLSIYHAKGALADANYKISKVMVEKPKWFDQSGSPLPKVMRGALELSEEIAVRDEPHDPPPDDLGIRGIFMGPPASKPNSNKAPRSASAMAAGQHPIIPPFSPLTGASFAFGSPILSMI